MIFDQRKAILAALQIVVPRMMKEERGPMVDKPHASVPHQHVGGATRSIDIRHERNEPDDSRCERGIRLSDHWIKHHRAREIVERDIQTCARLNQCLDLRIRLGPRQCRIELHEYDFWHWQFERARKLSSDELRDQHLRSLTGTAEL